MQFQQSEGTATLRRFYFAIALTDGSAPATGQTFSGSDLQIIKGGGTSFSNFAGTATEIAGSDGLYVYEFTATELDTLGAIAFKVEKTGVRTLLMQPGEVVGFDPYDAIRLGLTALPNANAEAAGGLFTRGSGAGQINQNANGQVDTRTVSMAADVVTASAIATDAIGSAEIAATGATKIAAAIWDEARSGHTTAGSFGQGVASVQGNVTGSVASVTGAVGSVTGAVGSVTGNVGGNVTGSVGSVAAGGITASSIASAAITSAKFAADAIDSNAIAATGATEVADAVWNTARTGHATAGTFGEGVASVTGAVGSVTGNVGGNVTGSVGSVAASGISASSIATGAITNTKFAAGAIDSAAIASSAFTSAKFATDAISSGALSAGAASKIAAAAMDEAIGGHTTAGTVGELLNLPVGTVLTDAGNTALTFKTNRSETEHNHWKDALLVWRTGALAGQVKKVDVFNEATGFITVKDGFTTTPTAGDTFFLVNK